MNIIKYSLTLCLLITVPFTAWPQDKANKKHYSINAIVTDTEGIPLSNATIYANEGSTIVTTSTDGSFTMELQTDDVLLIEAPGFEPLRIFPSALSNNTKVALTKNAMGLGSDDKVYLPFGVQHKRQLAGDVTVINPDDISRYDHNKSVYQIIQGRVPGLFGKSNLNGIGDATIIIDGLPRNNFPTIPIEEVEQITILKDAAARALYGTKGDNGMILITTKKGEAGKKQLGFNVQTGINTPISYPKYLGAADYMDLYNEARENDNLLPLYTEGAIDSTKRGLNPYKYPDVDYYSPTFLADYTTSTRVSGVASGGNEKTQYFSSINWARSNSLVNMGEATNESNNNINIRGNVNFELNSILTASIEGVANFRNSNSPRYNSFDNYWQLAANYHPNYFPLLIPVDMVEDSTYLISAKLVNGQYLGGTPEYPDNIYGDLYRNGSQKSVQRNVMFNSAIDLDLGFITEGLTARGYLSFDFYNSINYAQEHSYAIYETTWHSDSLTADSLSITKNGLDEFKRELATKNPGFDRRVGFVGVLNYNKLINNEHQISANAIAYRYQYTFQDTITPNNRSDITLPNKDLHFGLRANYMYRNKYIAELSATYAGSPALPEGEKWGLSPTLALGWVLSEESFLSGISALNYLKLRGSFGQIKTDESFNTDDDHYLYLQSYGGGNGNFEYNFGDNQNGTSKITRLQNSNLGFEIREELNVGIEAVLFENVHVNASYFNSKKKDQLTRVQYQYTQYIGNTFPFTNFNSDEAWGYYGGISLNKNKGDFRYNVGANFVYRNSKRTKYDEQTYEYDYQYRQGQPTDAMYGFKFLGFFADSAEILSSPEQKLGSVRPGDMKYADLNNDSIIDNNDKMMIGNSSARIQYSMHVNLAYKNLEIFVLGTGQQGANAFKAQERNNAGKITNKDKYYWVFGDRKYSEEVLGRWTPETKDIATYPRLSADNNNNNYVNSDFWMYENNWFTIHTIQLTYSLPQKLASKLYTNNLSVYLSAGNVLTISTEKEIRELNIGSAPQNRNYRIGLNVNF